MSRTSKDNAPDSALGATVRLLLWSRGLPYKALSEPLGIGTQIVGMKVRGEVGWSLSDLYKVAKYFDIPPAMLLPQVVDDSDASQFAPAGIAPELILSTADSVIGDYYQRANITPPNVWNSDASSARLEGLEPPTF